MSGTKNPKQTKTKLWFSVWLPIPYAWHWHSLCAASFNKVWAWVYELAHSFIRSLEPPGDYWCALASIVRLHLLKNYWTNLYQISYVASVRRVRKCEIVNFMIPLPPNPRGDNLVVRSVKLMYFLNAIFLIPRAGILRVWSFKSCIENALFRKKSS